MAQPLTTRRTTSLTGSSRLSLSVGKASSLTTPTGAGAGRHPLKQDYVHRPPGAKVDYEKEIRKVATFGSIESFLHLYSHLTSPAEMAPVTDILVFASRIQRPGIWEEMANGGKFTLRLLHPITPLLYETILFALIGDQFDDTDSVVGIVLSVRQTEDILSVWVDEEGDSVRSGALREKIISILNLPAGTQCEYRSNRALLDAATSVLPINGKAEDGQIGGVGKGGGAPHHGVQTGGQGGQGYAHTHQHSHQHGHGGTGSAHGHGHGQGHGHGHHLHGTGGSGVHRHERGEGLRDRDRERSGASTGSGGGASSFREYGSRKEDGAGAGERRNGWGSQRRELQSSQ